MRTMLHRAAATAVALATLVSFMPARAAFSQRDVLIKASGNSSVYYLASDGRRYVFPNGKTFDTWFTSFGAVQTVSDADLQSFPLGGNVTYRPGIRLVKITTDPKVYAVDANGTLRWLSGEQVAVALYGSDWNRKVDDVPDAFFVNYRLGSTISDVAHFDPFAVSDAARTINADRGMGAGSNALRAGTAPNAPRRSPSSGSGSSGGGSGSSSSSSCDADVWTCTEWSACASSGRKTRTCELSTDCPNRTSSRPPTSESCSYTATSGGRVSVEDATEDGNVAPGSDVVLAKFRLSASNEDLRLTKAAFTVEDAVAVASLRLYDGGSSISRSVTVNGNGDVQFSSLDLVIPRNGSKDVVVRGRLNPVGPSGAPSGSNAKVTMRTTSGGLDFEMVGANSGSSTRITSIPGGNKEGNDKFVRKTVLSFENVSLPSTRLVAGDVVAARVRVTAGDAGDASIKALTVKVAKSSGLSITTTGGSRTTVREQGSGSNVSGSSTAFNCDMGSTSCTVRVEFADELVVAAGDSKTLDVRLNVLNVQNGSSISTSLEADSGVRTGELSNGSNADQVRVDGANVSFAWSDNSDVPHDADVGGSSEDWISGAFVEGLANDPQTMRE